MPEPKRDPIGDPYVMTIDEYKTRWLVHLSPPQINAINEAVNEFKTTFNGRRPTPDEYEKIERKLLTIPVAPVDKRRPVKSINNVRQGYGTKDVVPLDGFNPDTDLPEGWGIYPWWDSGNNYHLVNAAQMAWTEIWNNWRPF